MSMFAPKDGICWSCNRDIYKDYMISNPQLGQKEEKLSKGRTRGENVVGCPHCYRSFCD